MAIVCVCVCGGGEYFWEPDSPEPLWILHDFSNVMKETRGGFVAFFFVPLWLSTKFSLKAVLSFQDSLQVLRSSQVWSVDLLLCFFPACCFCWHEEGRCVYGFRAAALVDCNGIFSRSSGGQVCGHDPRTRRPTSVRCLSLHHHDQHHHLQHQSGNQR